MKRTTYFRGNKMIIKQSDRMKTVTDLLTGKTELFKDGKLINSWPNMRIKAFENLQRDLYKAATKMSQND